MLLSDKVMVLQVISGLHAGGMESMIMNYLKNIDRSKIQMDFLVFSGRSYYDEEVESLGSKIYRVTSRRKNPIKNYIEIDKFFKLHKEYKIVHIHQGITYFKPLISAYKNGIPVRIVHSHGIDENYKKKLALFKKYYAVPKICKLATHYFACSNSAANDIYTDYIIKNKNYKIINNAINVEEFIFDVNKRMKLRKKMGISESTLVLGNVGRLRYEKNQEFLIDVFNYIHKKNKDSILLLVGDGEDKGRIKKKIDNLGLSDSVKLMGLRRDVAKLMQVMDIYVMPSRFEGLPCVGVEAQASGLPCIFSDVVTKEVDITGNCKFIGLNESIQNWGKEILKLRNFNRTNTYLSILENGYDIKTEAKKLEKFYYEQGKINI